MNYYEHEGAYATGTCLDKFGWKPVAFISVFLYSTGYVLAFIGKWKNFYWLFYLTGNSFQVLQGIHVT